MKAFKTFCLKALKITKRYTLAILEAVLLILALAIVAFGFTYIALSLAILGILVRMIGTMKGKASIDFLKSIDEGAKQTKKSVREDRKAIKATKKSIKAEHKAAEHKATANSLLE